MLRDRIFRKAPVASASARQYWRVRATATDGGGIFALAEVEFRASPGGATQTTGGTPINSSSFGAGFEATKAFDGNGATLWSAGGNPGWIGYQFATPVVVNEVMLRARSDSTGFAPSFFFIESSSDNVTWTTEWQIEGLSTGWTLGVQRVFTRPTVNIVRTRWRMFIQVTNGGGNPSAVEIEFRGTIGGANLATGGTAISSSDFSGTFNAAKAFDANTTTLWSAASIGTGWIGYQFASAALINQMLYRARNDIATQYPQSFQVQSSDDGITWGTEWSVPSATGWTSGEVRTFARP